MSKSLDELIKELKINPPILPDTVVSQSPIKLTTTYYEEKLYDEFSDFMKHYTDDTGKIHKYYKGDPSYYFNDDKSIVIVQDLWTLRSGAEDDRELAYVFVVKFQSIEYRVYCQFFYKNLPENYYYYDMTDIVWSIFDIEFDDKLTNEDEAKASFEKVICSLKSEIPKNNQYIKNIEIIYADQYYIDRPTKLLGE